ncbi:uncharacterized protein LOC124399727 isoform X2 [Silurus meridionalis]|uniref:DUF7789 domain-containing protein n=1 Tax=Silurus meridionalis TaxID=175797 RepID=A0A8T0APX7_SILME|nr:uncharacterized protein LOC124399727 isoform X2 [Silurus meridionalis]KAF7695101.1 hypothetical protein HF521_006824 [Silurus meridionalis]KAI5101528.1 hypothetical protein C0J45_8731 [Silurus meridionalis]
MDESRPLLPQRQESMEGPSPNLKPRHGELIPTPCGPIKKLSELQGPVKIYFCFTLLSMVVLFILTIFNISKESQNEKKKGDNDDLTVSIIQLVGIAFCFYYIVRGVLQENKQELIVFGLCVFVLMVRSIINYVVPEEKETLLTVRFACIICLGVAHLICVGLLITRPNMMAFRVGGALESLQEQYCLLNLCFSMVTFDLQAQVCLCILILTSGPFVSTAHRIILGIGVFWAVITAAIGGISVLKEVKPLVWIFALQNLPQLAYFIYLLYSTITNWGESKTYILEAATITGCLLSVAIKCVLFWGLYSLYRRFGLGLREKMFSSDNQQVSPSRIGPA